MAHRNWIAALVAADPDPRIQLLVRPETDPTHDADFFARVLNFQSLQTARALRRQCELGFIAVELERALLGDGLALSRCHVLALPPFQEVAA